MNKEQITFDHNRKAEYDLIRILAMIEVIGLHTSSNSIVGGICSNCVMLFVMLSGCLKLRRDKEFSWKKWSFSVVRLICIFLVSSIFYELFVSEKHNLTETLKGIVIGYYHLWYLYMIIGLYICIPIILQIKKDSSTYNLLWGISMLTAIVIPSISSVTNTTGLDYIFNSLANLFIGKGFLIYFISGDLLVGKENDIKKRVLIYLFGAISIVVLLCGNVNELARFCYSGAVFVLISSLGRKIRNNIFKNVLAFVSDQCLMVYIVHAAVIQLLIRYTDNSYYLFVLTGAISFIISIMINYFINIFKGIYSRLKYAG